MTTRTLQNAVIPLMVCVATSAWAQSSSLVRSAGQPAASPYTNNGNIPTGPAPAAAAFAAAPPREVSRPATRALEQTSFIAVPPAAPRKFKVHDLITIIVRQQKTYEAQGMLNNRNKWDVSGKLSDWFRFHDDIKHLGSDNLTNGQPGFKFNYDGRYQQQSNNDREDRFTTHIQAEVIDIKPNGNLVLEAKLREQHDEEEFTITLTGMCRSEDVTPANSILSTQVADLVLVEKNHGAVRDATKRGWLPKILDWGKLF